MIEHIRIQNFKSLRDVSVDLSPVTVLIGRSGTGKSNFLRAIRFLRNYLLTGNAAIDREGPWPRLYPFERPAPLSFDVRFRIPGFDEPFDYAVAWKLRNQLGNLTDFLEREELRYGGKVLLSWHMTDAGYVRFPDFLPHMPTDGLKPRLGMYPSLPEAVSAFTAWTTGIGWHDFPSSVFVDAAPKGRSADAVSVSGLEDAANNYRDVAKDIAQNLRDPKSRRHMLARARRINPGVTSIELDNPVRPTKLVVTHAINGQPIALDMAQESDGFRRFYAHLLALYQLPSKLLLMFEEPENGIYPGALANLAEEFNESAVAGRGQILLTTHSPQLLDGFNADSIRVVDLDAEQCTRISPLAEGQKEALRQRLLDPGELLTLTSPVSMIADSEDGQ